jgi:hypothetical protein
MCKCPCIQMFVKDTPFGVYKIRHVADATMSLPARYFKLTASVAASLDTFRPQKNKEGCEDETDEKRYTEHRF